MNHNLIAKPHKVGIAVQLLYITTGVGIFRSIIETFRFVEVPLSSYTISINIFFLGISWFFIFMIGKGYNWARHTFLAVFIFGTSNFALPLIKNFSIAPVSVLIDMTQTIIQIIALVFLFQKSSSQWFRNLK